MTQAHTLTLRRSVSVVVAVAITAAVATPLLDMAARIIL
jgi:hypothetical protein